MTRGPTIAGVPSGAALLATLALTLVAPAAMAAPKPKVHRGQYDLSILGFNDGDPYRIKGAEAEAVLTDPDAMVYQYTTTDWMAKSQRGAWVKLADVVSRFPERQATELFKVYEFDFSADRTNEVLIIPTPTLGPDLRFAPSILRIGADKMTPLWAATTLPGERFRVVDVRDLNGDNDPEILLGGEGSQSAAYQFMELVGLASGSTWVVLDVPHVDSLHYVDLDQDNLVEVVVRQRVGRKGPASHWTYIDTLHRWTGIRFEPNDATFPRYHDEQTIPTLIGDLIDNHDERLSILDEKLAAIARMRELTLSWTPKPKNHHAKKLQALSLVQKRQYKAARTKLEALDKNFPYDAQVLLGLAQVRADLEEWEGSLDAALRAISCDAKNREAWWWAGVGFTAVQERSSAVASMHLAARLNGNRDEGLAFLRARRGAPGMDSELQAILDQAIALSQKN
ncbi:MAG TPA: hypothetical protein PK095_14555 [Myxococcota bacterium]|nr:hypothetical protein [Myxococcota bacterium]